MMRDDSAWEDPVEADEPVLPRRPLKDDSEMDITPMIDCTFLLLIFFLVCSTIAPDAGLELPGARHGTAVSHDNSVIITVREQGGRLPALVFLGEGGAAQELPGDPKAQARQIAAVVEQGARQGKSNVLIKATKGCRHGDVSRVAEAANQVEGIKLNMAVDEIK